MNKLTIKFVSKSVSHTTFADCEIPIRCRLLLEALERDEKYLSITTGQELVLYMFRALLFSEYKHLQKQVTFLIDGVEVKFDHRMRTDEDNYPHSLFDECLCVLLGAEENDF